MNLIRRHSQLPGHLNRRPKQQRRRRRHLRRLHHERVTIIQTQAHVLFSASFKLLFYFDRRDQARRRQMLGPQPQRLLHRLAPRPHPSHRPVRMGRAHRRPHQPPGQPVRSRGRRWPHDAVRRRLHLLIRRLELVPVTDHGRRVHGLLQHARQHQRAAQPDREHGIRVRRLGGLAAWRWRRQLVHAQRGERGFYF